jgi:hypothetical protein
MARIKACTIHPANFLYVHAEHDVLPLKGGCLNTLGWIVVAGIEEFVDVALDNRN